MSPFEEQKAALREEAFARRAKIPAADRADAANIVATLFFDGVPLEPGQVVAAYWPIRDEIDCKPILTRLMDSGQQVCLPVVTGDGAPLELRLWQPGQPLYPSGFGTLAPSETAPRAVPDVVIIPLLAFDRLGTRLGYGKGYYDRTLEVMDAKPLIVGIAFAAQELEYIPREPHDMPLDILVTETGVQRFEAV
ncbi:5-formyltetrahydrofolate cyclo-ligase [Pelagibacterium xiamenense]|uniref:5-formyltetrahydrofolate cyclo-ligase n=1 Tax=Pelagibacterium xiamenense TaxID=2901140 RepID=UPI001E3D5DAC|nr:5-formyltetrahydrofolate cyclo-ligase [Pelagibacterium xiamenense]MCD7060465.1 5-formyltetrahydrofolate cyclo-ligase [Pelagibacterium xiamenense]